MKFLLIQALDEAHLYSQFTAALCEGLLEIGCEAVVLPVPIGHPEGLLAALTASRYDAVVSFSSIFGDAAFAGSGQSLFDALGVKFVGWQLDHPIYVHHTLSPAMARRHSIYPNDDHVRFARAIGISGRAASLLPGARLLPAPLTAHAQRDWPIFVAATWNDVPERGWETMEDSPAKRLFVEVVERLTSDPHVSVLDAFNGAVGQLGMPVRLGADAGLDAELIKLLRGPLSYVRHMDRVRIIDALIDADLPLTICGTGWREHVGDRTSVTLLDSVPFSALPALYDNAKVVLNLNAANGGSERALQAMMSGAAVVSDQGSALANAFVAETEIAFFDRAAPQGVVEVVAGLLESDRGEAMARGGHERAMATALWRHRAQDLANLLG